MKRGVVVGIALAMAISARADIAIVVGINSYGGAMSLKGAVNDATDMRKSLGGLGFDVKNTFTDKQATQAAIESALKDVESKIKKTDRFVFYYAGHGLAEPRVLVPVDFNGRNGISVDRLYDAVRAIRAKAKSATVILDCCFSGAFSKDIFTARCYPQPGIKSGAPKIPKPDTQAFVVPEEAESLGDRPICYVTAAHADQKSIEMRFEDDGLHHGLFTHSLLPHLASLSKGDAQTWQQVEGKVNGQLNDLLVKSHLRQDSSVTEEYRPLAPFAGMPAGQRPKANRVPKSVYDLVQQEKPTPTDLEIVVQPGKYEYLLGERTQLSVSVKKAGYLVVVCCDPEPFLYWPRDRSAASSKVEAGETRDLRAEGSKGQVFDSVGDNRIVAYLFQTSQDAEKLLSSIGTTQAKSSDLKARTLPGTPVEYGTASRTFSIGEGLAGDLKIADPVALWRRIRGTPLFDWLNQRLRWSGRDLTLFDTLVREDASASAIARDRLSMLFNDTIFASEAWTFEALPDEVKLAPEGAEKVKNGVSLTIEDRIAAIRATFGESIVPKEGK